MMKCAAVAERPVGVLLVAAAALAVAGLGVPSAAHASSSMDVNACVDEEDMWYDEEDSTGPNVTECSSTARVLPTVANENLVKPIVSVMNWIFGNNNVGGAPEEAQEQMNNGGSLAATAAQIDQLARWVDHDAGSGMAAGAPTETTGQAIQRWVQPLRNRDVTTWFNTNWSSPRDTHRQTRYDSDIWTLTLGADMPIYTSRIDGLMAGIFGSFTNSDVDSTFNTGGVQSKLGTVGPYFQYTVNDNVAVDFTVAAIFGQHENTVGTPSGAMGMGSSPKARGEQDVDGFFVSMNANGNYWIGNWGLQGRLGFLHSDMETESFDLASGGGSVRVPGVNNELTQFSLASQINYFCDGGLPHFEEVFAMPFFRITFNYDIDHDNIQIPAGIPQHPNDDDEIILGWGVSLFGDSPISGSIEGGRSLGRSRFESWTVSTTVSYAF